MTAPLSKDLRTRLIAAVEGGQSRRAAAKRFGIAASTAIKWMERWRREGHAQPRPMGGDRHSHCIEAHASEILALVDETPDITLAEIVAHCQCRVKFGPPADSVMGRRPTWRGVPGSGADRSLHGRTWCA